MNPTSAINPACSMVRPASSGTSGRGNAIFGSAQTGQKMDSNSFLLVLEQREPLGRNKPQHAMMSDKMYSTGTQPRTCCDAQPRWATPATPCTKRAPAPLPPHRLGISACMAAQRWSGGPDSDSESEVRSSAWGSARCTTAGMRPAVPDPTDTTRASAGGEAGSHPSLQRGPWRHRAGRWHQRQERTRPSSVTCMHAQGVSELPRRQHLADTYTTRMHAPRHAGRRMHAPHNMGKKTRGLSNERVLRFGYRRQPHKGRLVSSTATSWRVRECVRRGHHG